jgi:hypothetical protein
MIKIYRAPIVVPLGMADVLTKGLDGNVKEPPVGPLNSTTHAMLDL